MIPFQFKTFVKSLLNPVKDTRFNDGGAKRWFFRILVFLTFPFYLGAFFVFQLIDEVFFGGYKKQSLNGPIQVIGNPRSGTTFLHRVLARDEETFVTTRLWQMVFPALCVHYLIRGMAALDRAIGRPLFRLMSWSQNRALKGADKYHKIRFDVPEEDEGFFVLPWASGFLSMAFPHDIWPTYNKMDEMPEPERESLMGYYYRCIQKVVYQDPANRRLLSKNPLFCAKIQSVYDTLPDAKVVYLVRHPADMLCSVQNMLLNMWLAQGLKVPEGESLRRQGLVEWAEYNYAHSLKVLDAAPKGSYVIVKYDDLVSDPKSTVEHIYQELGIELTPTYAQILIEEAEKAAKYKSKHHYSLERFDMTHQEIEESLPFIYDRFDFPRLSLSAPPPIPAQPEVKAATQSDIQSEVQAGGAA